MERIYRSKIEIEYQNWEITGTERGITGVYPVASDFVPDENEITALAAAELREYFARRRTEFTVPLDLRGTPFQKQVWEALTGVPYGKTESYSRIAQRIGKPGAACAVGQAIGRNPCLVFVPCHRILGKNGSLTGFSAGMALKIRLLELEGIRPGSEIGSG